MNKNQVPGARFINDSECEFILWAPKATSVKLILSQNNSCETILERDNEGYWKSIIRYCEVGSRYHYQIDEKELVPDPASLYQPEGILGDSELIKFSDFIWEDHGWQNSSPGKLIIYELHTGTFSPEGTFDGIISKLDYLKKLGVNAIELMPVAQYSGKRNWGYDGVFIYAVQNSYGGPQGLMNLVNKCHKEGIAVILDVVYNHHGPEGNDLGLFGPYMSDVHYTPWGKAFNFDGEGRHGVRNYFIQNALMWLRDFHIDGLRMDAVHAMHDSSEKHIIKEIAEVVADLNRETGRNHFLIGEVNLNDVKYTRPLIKGGFGLDAQWNDDFHHSLQVKSTGEKNGYYKDFTDPACFAKAYKEAFILKGQFSIFRNKNFGKPAGSTLADKFIVYSQNHDQVGNRRHGERNSNLVSHEMQKLIAASTLLSPYIPMIFMGEEYGEANPFLFFIDFQNQNLMNLIKKGRENEFKMLGYKVKDKNYDPGDISAFKRSTLNWDLLTNDNKSAALFVFYSKLIQIRRTHPAFELTDRRKMTIAEKNKLIEIVRWKGRKKILIILNFDKKSLKYSIEANNAKYHKIIDSAELCWGGKGSNSPDILSFSDSFFVEGESALVYSS
jgi:maltooligosyltrehalose trehalohydrolase